MNKQTAINRVRALLAKTVDNGATEAEALSAAAKAKEIMAQYQVSLTDTQIREEGCVTGSPEKYTGGWDVQTRLAVSLAAFCDCRVWKSKGQIKYFGLESDVEFAHWLTAALQSFCWSAAKDFENEEKRMMETCAWATKRDFMLGCIQRINKRVEEETRKRKPQQTATGSSLVVVKGAIVEEAFAKLNMRLSTHRRYEKRVSSQSAFSQGQGAGNRANFSRSMGGGSTRAIT